MVTKDRVYLRLPFIIKNHRTAHSQSGASLNCAPHANENVASTRRYVLAARAPVLVAGVCVLVARSSVATLRPLRSARQRGRKQISARVKYIGCVGSKFRNRPRINALSIPLDPLVPCELRLQPNARALPRRIKIEHSLAIHISQIICCHFMFRYGRKQLPFL